MNEELNEHEVRVCPQAPYFFEDRSGDVVIGTNGEELDLIFLKKCIIGLQKFVDGWTKEEIESYNQEIKNERYREMVVSNKEAKSYKKERTYLPRMYLISLLGTDTESQG